MSANDAKRDQNHVTTLLAVTNDSALEVRKLKVDPSTDELLVKASVSITPSGTQDVNLTQVGGTAFALGQQLASASLPIVLTVAQISTLTPQTNALTDAQLRASAVPISAASLPLPSGAATAANQQTNALTDTQLRASAVPVSGTFFQATQPVSGTFFQATQPVSIAGTISSSQSLSIDGTTYTLKSYSGQISTNTTVTPISTLAFISSIALIVTTGGTTSTLSIRDKGGTVLSLINNFATTAILTTPQIVSFPIPVKVSSGFDIITAGVAPATVSVFISYWSI